MMRVRIEMELEDVPGQLVKVLEPISNLGANIQNVIHQREEKTPLGRVPVTVIFEVDDRERFEKILDSLKESGAHITQVGEKEAAIRFSVLLVGHVVDTDIRDTVNKLNSLEGVRISDLSLAMGESGEESAARLAIETMNEDQVSTAISKLNEIAEKKELLVIKSLGGGSKP